MQLTLFEGLERGSANPQIPKGCLKSRFAVLGENYLYLISAFFWAKPFLGEQYTSSLMWIEPRNNLLQK